MIHRIDFIGRSTRRVKSHRSESFRFLGRIDIGKKAALLFISLTALPAADIRLINMVVVIGRFHSCISHAAPGNVGILIGHIKDPILAEFFSPGILTDKSTVFFRLLFKILFRILVIPPQNQNVVRWLFSLRIIVSTRFFIIIIQCCRSSFSIHVERSLHRPEKVNHFLNSLPAHPIQKLHFLYMHAGGQPIRRILVTIGIFALQHRAIPTA